MVALGRKQSKIFASNAPLSQITVFRTTQTDSPQTSTDPNIIQNEKYLDGWLNADNTGNMLPFAEDMNAVLYTLSYNTSYLYEKGIPEYSSTQVYYENSFCQYQGKLYRCKLDDTLNYVPTTTARWDEIPTSSYSATTIGAGTVNYGTVYAGTDGTQFQFKTIIGGSNVTISETNDSLTISASVEGQTANFTATAPLSYLNGVLTLPAATSSQSGYLTASDWTSFNSKLSNTIFRSNNTWTGSNTFADISATSLDLNGTTYTSIPTDTGDLTNGAGFITASDLNSFSANSILATGTNSTLGSDSASWLTGYIDSLKTLAIDSPSPAGGNFVISSTARLYLKSYRADSTNTTTLVFGGKTIIPETNLDINLGGRDNRFKYIYGNVLDLTTTGGTGGATAAVRSDARLELTSYYGGSGCTLELRGGTLCPATAPSATPVDLGYYASNLDLRYRTVYATAHTFYSGQTIDTDNAHQNIRITSNLRTYTFGTGSAGAVAGSDEVLKKNIITMPDGALDIINELRPVKYDLKSEDRNDSYSAGFIAQETDNILPNLTVPPTTEDDYYGLDYAGFVPYLVKAIQELSAKVDSLEQQLRRL